MNILGVQLNKPSFTQLTGSAIMAAGLWLAIVAVMRTTGQDIVRIEAGAALLVVFWGCVCASLGIRVDRGRRRLAVNVVCGGVLLGVYQFAVMLFGA